MPNAANVSGLWDHLQERVLAPDVGLVFIDPNDKAYLSITGRACVMRDADQIKATRRKTDEVWWPGGPNDPDVCLLRIEPPRNCGMDRRALSLLPSSSPRRGQPGRRRSSARTERRPSRCEHTCSSAKAFSPHPALILPVQCCWPDGSRKSTFQNLVEFTAIRPA
jgi:hypothetical protein